ncbi:MAG: sigma-70 family RNA polymerase sigma factor [Acidobacteria bacterium]|nr:sigma-70 family RNA polymerase sigma factor [Acidobacteriota bacterium]
MEFSDEYLVQEYLDGDVSRFNLLIQRWQKRIFNFIYRNIGNYEEAQDLTQDTFAKAFVKVKDLDDPAKFSAWLYRVALNECRMAFRRGKGKQNIPLEIYDQTETRELQLRGVMSEPEDTPEESLQRKESIERLRSVLSAIPEEQRLIIVMKEYEDLKFHEIAAILEIPLSTVKSRMYLGLKTLRRLLVQRELSRR